MYEYHDVKKETESQNKRRNRMRTIQVIFLIIIICALTKTIATCIF